MKKPQEYKNKYSKKENIIERKIGYLIVVLIVITILSIWFVVYA